MTDTKPPRFHVRPLIASVYVPSFAFAVGQGAIIPVVALTARDLGASLTVAGLAVGARGLGTMAFDVFAGRLVGRLGDRRAMLVATVVLLISLVGCALSPEPLPFVLFMFLMGCAWSVWLIARLAYVTEALPMNVRGRALSTLGGVQRIGTFIGPFIGAIAITAGGGIDVAYFVHIVLAVVGCVVLFVVPDPHGSVHGGPWERLGVAEMGHRHREVLSSAGVTAMMISALRASRQAIIPLWASMIGLDAAQASLIFGISAAVDMTLFYPAGSASDRWGRKAVAIPCLIVMAVGLLLVPLTSSFTTLALVGLLLGFGNGIGSGIVMTLGSDFSPVRGRAEFLGVWRLVTDVGTAGGPLLVAAVQAAASLGAASVTLGVVGLVGAATVARTMPEPPSRGDGAAPSKAD